MKQQKNNQENKPKEKPNKTKGKTQKPKSNIKWFILITSLAFAIAFVFGFVTEMWFGTSSIIVCVLIVIGLIIIAVTGDIFAFSVAYADLAHLNAMASRRIKGASTSVKLIKNSDKVLSILSDILGDVCSIISGAVGLALSLIIINDGDFSIFQQALIFALVNGTIAAFTITAKSMAKKIAIKNSTKIVLKFGKILSVFAKK